MIIQIRIRTDLHFEWTHGSLRSAKWIRLQEAKIPKNQKCILQILHVRIRVCIHVHVRVHVRIHVRVIVCNRKEKGRISDFEIIRIGILPTGYPA